jgi:hypothetical protein
VIVVGLLLTMVAESIVLHTWLEDDVVDGEGAYFCVVELEVLGLV